MIKTAYNPENSPVLTVFSEDMVYDIHAATLDVLEKTGCKTSSDEDLTLIIGAGVNVEGEIVKFPQYIVMVKSFLKGVKFNPETFALEVIEEVGPGGISSRRIPLSGISKRNIGFRPSWPNSPVTSGQKKTPR